jgi:peptide-methionine (R)-S-oxide reductase
LRQFVNNDAGALLQREHKEALTKGLSFIPTRPPDFKDVERIELDLKKLIRNLNLRIHWGIHQATATKSYVSKVTKSDWNPPEYIKYTSTLQNYIKSLTSLLPKKTKKTADQGILETNQDLEVIQEDFEVSQNQDFKGPRNHETTTQNQNTPITPKPDFEHYRGSNLNQRAFKAWNELKKNKLFYILKADKGGKTVLWSRENYKKEALRQLEDSKVYRELKKEEAEQAYQDLLIEKFKVIEALKKANNITAAESTRLKEETFKMPSIYFLPKIHKDKREDTNTYAGRPIIAAVGGILKSLDEYLAHLTAPLLKLIPGSLMDTRDLINNLEGLQSLPKDFTLFSADVESLYPSIPWKEGIASATRFYASKYYALQKTAKKEGLLPPPKPTIFKWILTLVLERNFFNFQNERWFHQQSGTAMGCSISVYFANTFMYFRTKKLLDHPPKFLLYLGRYIDDLIGIFAGPKEEIQGIFSEVVDDNLRLTFVIGGSSLEALDLLIRIAEPENQPSKSGEHTSKNGAPTLKDGDQTPKYGKLKLSLYRKPTDGHQFVHRKSAHPDNLLRSLPYSQLLRIKRNCSNQSDYTKEASQLLKRFRTRGYSQEELLASFDKCDRCTRKSLLGPTEKKTLKSARLTFVTTYSPYFKDATRKLVSTFYDSIFELPEVVERLPYLNPPLPRTKPRIAYKNGRKLGEGLGAAYKKGDKPEAADEEGDERPPKPGRALHTATNWSLLLGGTGTYPRTSTPIQMQLTSTPLHLNQSGPD